MDDLEVDENGEEEMVVLRDKVTTSLLNSHQQLLTHRSHAKVRHRKSRERTGVLRCTKLHQSTKKRGRKFNSIRQDKFHKITNNRNCRKTRKMYG